MALVGSKRVKITASTAKDFFGMDGTALPSFLDVALGQWEEISQGSLFFSRGDLEYFPTLMVV
jgi:hypothetical protein